MRRRVPRASSSRRSRDRSRSPSFDRAIREERGIVQEHDVDVVTPERPRELAGNFRPYAEARARQRVSLDMHGHIQVGSKLPGLRILDPGCVAKTYPKYWQDWDRCRPKA